MHASLSGISDRDSSGMSVHNEYCNISQQLTKQQQPVVVVADSIPAPVFMCMLCHHMLPQLEAACPELLNTFVVKPVGKDAHKREWHS